MARAVGLRARPSHARSNATPSGIAQGTTHQSRPAPAGGRPGTRQMVFGEEVYLWILLFIELAVMGALRKKFRRHHGG